mmetsp:Transcript_10305/g.27490  ORF Transcript_10305/g.27490 Transcript_10305/m.27490 type:complete len:400 (+) Transcript_10305:101-1300(+)
MKLLIILAGCLSACVQAAPDEPVPALSALAADDECDANEDGGCSLSALQLRGDKAVINRTAIAHDPPQAQNPSLLQKLYPDMKTDSLMETKLESCRHMLARVRKGWVITFSELVWPEGYHITRNNGTWKNLTAVPMQETLNESYNNLDGTMELFFNKFAANIEIRTRDESACSSKNSGVVWFYPQGDPNDAFAANEFVCSRLGMFIDDEATTCLNIYRVDSPVQADWIAKRFVPDGHLRHLVLGGHGNDDSFGVLEFSTDYDGDMFEGSNSTKGMLDALKTKMAPYATIFLDSCFSAKNGMAKYVSESIPTAWVFGGIVSLDQAIEVRVTGFPDDSDFAPPRYFTDHPDTGAVRLENPPEAIKVFRGGKALGMVTVIEDIFQWMIGLPAPWSVDSSVTA